MSAVILGSTLGCFGKAIRVADDGGADGRTAPAKEAGRASDVGPGRSDGQLDANARRDAGDSGGAPGDGASLGPDLGFLAPDSPLVFPDGDIVVRLDSSALGGDVGGFPDAALDQAVDAALAPPDLGSASPPDLADAASHADLASSPLSLCVVPDCWANLMRTCQPAGTCTAQSATGYENLCFDEAVKVLANIDETAGKMITTVTKGSQICYQLDWDLAGGAASGATVTGVLKDGSGAPVATISDDATGYSVVTCAGAQPVVLSEGCDFVAPVVCEDGACGP